MSVKYLSVCVCCRINLGGANVVAYLNRLLQLSRPPLLPHLTLTRAQEMVHAHCYVAVDYQSELHEWGSGQPLTHTHTHTHAHTHACTHTHTHTHTHILSL